MIFQPGPRCHRLFAITMLVSFGAFVFLPFVVLPTAFSAALPSPVTLTRRAFVRPQKEHTGVSQFQWRLQLPLLMLRGGDDSVGVDDTASVSHNNTDTNTMPSTGTSPSPEIFVITPEQRDSLLSNGSVDDPSWSEIREAFEKDGVIVIRGLLDDELLQDVVAAGDVIVEESTKGPKNAKSSFTSLKFGPVFLSPPTTEEECSKRENVEGSSGNENGGENDDEEEKDLSAFRRVATQSAIPHVIARVLLNLDRSSTGEEEEREDDNEKTINTTPTTLRVLKDAFLAKGAEGQCCGWHVDDFGFWPTSAHQSPGVNAWVALDDIPPEFGGGLAVAPQSHEASWRHEAYETIGSTQTFPPEGYTHPKEFFGKSPATTCNLEKANPELNDVIDRTKRIYNFRRGDVLFHTRWLFHRSVPLTALGLKHFAQQDGSSSSSPPSAGSTGETEEGMPPTISRVVKRYSIRYEPGSATLQRGFTIEPSCLYDSANEGRTLDEVCAQTGPWYPQCWPKVNDGEIQQLLDVVTKSKLPCTEKLAAERYGLLGPFFAEK